MGTEIGKMLIENNKVVETKIQMKEDESNKVVEAKMKAREEAMQTHLDLLEVNINESLDNIKKNGISQAGSGTRDGSKTTEEWDRKGNKYGFNHDYKIESTDRWTDVSSAGFRNFKLMAERYLWSAKPEYAEGLELLMKYVQNKDTEVNLKEENTNNELVHKDIIDKVPKALELDSCYLMN